MCHQGILTFFLFIHTDGAWTSKPQAILSQGFVVKAQSCDTVYCWRQAFHMALDIHSQIFLSDYMRVPRAC